MSKGALSIGSNFQEKTESFNFGAGVQQVGKKKTSKRILERVLRNSTTEFLSEQLEEIPFSSFAS